MSNLFVIALVVAILLVFIFFIWKRKPEKTSSARLKAESPILSDEKSLIENKGMGQSPVLQEEVVEELSAAEVVERQISAVDCANKQEGEVEAKVSYDAEQVEDIEVEKSSRIWEDDDLAEMSSPEFLSRENYELWLLDLKKRRLDVLTMNIKNNDESGQEQHQVELVAITAALSFSEQAYAENISYREEAFAFLETIKTELSTMEYDMASKGICEKADTRPVEELFYTLTERKGVSDAFTIYHSGRLAEQRMDFHGAMKSYEKAVDAEQDNSDFIRSAGMLSLKLYSYQQAKRYFSSLVALFEKNNPDSVELALAKRDYAYALAMVGRNKKAGTLYKQVMHSLTQLLGGDDPEMGICWYQIAKLQETLGRYEQAEKPYRQALDIMDKSEQIPIICEIIDKLACLYMELEREEEAIPLFERLCLLKEETVHQDKGSMAIAYSHLAGAYRICGKYKEAGKSLSHSLSITEELHGKEHPAVGSVLQELTRLCEKQGEKDKAKEYQDRAAVIFQNILDEQEAGGRNPEKLTL